MDVFGFLEDLVLSVIGVNQPMFKLPRWSPSVGSGWATCHFAIAWAVIMTVALLGPLMGISPWAGMPILMVWATIKEFVFDLLIERDVVLGLDKDGNPIGSLVDWFWYLIGGICANATLLAVIFA